LQRSSASKVQILEYGDSKLFKPNIVVGLPEAGLVGSIATSYLAQVLQLPEIGYVESELEVPVIVVEKSVPKYPFRIYGRDNLVVFACDIPLTPRLATEFSFSLVDWALSKQSRLIIGASGLPSNDRLEQEQELPNVFYATTAQKETYSSIIGAAKPLEEGFIVGTYSLILKRCMAMRQPNITFFAKSHLDFPDPGAAAAVINILKLLLGIDIDIKPLLQESEQIRLKTRELMKRTQQSMKQMSQGAPELYT
jgi:uncharacterized protein